MPLVVGYKTCTDFHWLSISEGSLGKPFLHVPTSPHTSTAMIYGCDLIRVPDEGCSISKRAEEIQAEAVPLCEHYRVLGALVAASACKSYLGFCSIAPDGLSVDFDTSVKDRRKADSSPFCKHQIRQQCEMKICLRAKQNPE